MYKYSRYRAEKWFELQLRIPNAPKIIITNPFTKIIHIWCDSIRIYIYIYTFPPTELGVGKSLE